MDDPLVFRPKEGGHVACSACGQPMRLPQANGSLVPDQEAIFSPDPDDGLEVLHLPTLNTICFTVCLVCIVLGTLLSFAMIWGAHQSEFLWRAWLSIAVLFCASSLTLAVSRAYGGRRGVV